MARRGFLAKSSQEEIIFYSSLEEFSPLQWMKIYNSGKPIKSCNLTSSQEEAIKNKQQDSQVVIDTMKRLGISLVVRGDKEYPSILEEIPDPPLWLYVRGQIELLKNRVSLSVVGSRKPSTVALESTKLLLGEEIVSEIVTVSGLAYGIDRLVHQQSLLYGQPTIAVLAGGLDRIYPASHTQLSEQIVSSGGALISEYPPFSRPKAYRFPIRNRIIAGLSMATLIIEAAEKSGTLTTAKSCLDYNRDLLVVPADITRSAANGSNKLLAAGASAIINKYELAKAIGVSLKNTKTVVDSQAQKILNFIADQPLSLDELVARSKLTVDRLLPLLSQLEIDGLVFQPTFGMYQQKQK